MIEAKRIDYKETIIRNKTVPAWYECSYRYGGLEIAVYNSREDVVRLNTDLIGKDMKASYTDRMKDSKCPEAFEELMEYLDGQFGSGFTLSEYMNI